MKEPFKGSIKSNLSVHRSDQRKLNSSNSDKAAVVTQILLPLSLTGSTHASKEDKGDSRFNYSKLNDNNQSEILRSKINELQDKSSNKFDMLKSEIDLQVNYEMSPFFLQNNYLYNNLELRSNPNSRNKQSSQDLRSTEYQIFNPVESSLINNEAASNLSPTHVQIGNLDVAHLSESFKIIKSQAKEQVKSVQPHKVDKIYSSDFSFDEDDQSSGIFKNCINKLFDQESEYLNLKLGDIESELNRDDDDIILRYRKSQKPMESNISLREAEISINDEMIEANYKKSCLMFKIKKTNDSLDRKEILKHYESEDIDNSKNLALVNESNYTKYLQEFADELENNNRNIVSNTVGKQRSKFDRSKLFNKKGDICLTLDSDIDEFNGSKNCGEIKTGRFKTMLPSRDSDTSKLMSSNGFSPPAKKKSTFQC